MASGSRKCNRVFSGFSSSLLATRAQPSLARAGLTDLPRPILRYIESRPIRHAAEIASIAVDATRPPSLRISSALLFPRCLVAMSRIKDVPKSEDRISMVDTRVNRRLAGALCRSLASRSSCRRAMSPGGPPPPLVRSPDGSTHTSLFPPSDPRWRGLSPVLRRRVRRCELRPRPFQPPRRGRHTDGTAPGPAQCDGRPGDLGTGMSRVGHRQSQTRRPRTRRIAADHAARSRLRRNLPPRAAPHRRGFPEIIESG